MTAAIDFSPERVSDRMQIQDVMYRWCRAIDRLDYDAIRDVFHPDGIDDHGIYKGNVDGLIAWIQERHKTISFSMHSISNMLIEFAGTDTALVESYVNATQRYPEGGGSLTALTGGAEGKAGAGMDVVVFGRYVDELQRRNGEWKILRRTVVFDSTMMFEAPVNGPKMEPHWTVQSRTKEDFIYRKRASLGIKN